MSVSLRCILLLASILTFWYVVRKLRKAQIQIMDTVFWFGLSVIFIIFAIFPDLVYFLAIKLGFMASVNFIFLVMIFLLLMRVFLLTIKVSQFEDKLKNLTEELAIRENRRDKND